jgi:hypothetical protein
MVGVRVGTAGVALAAGVAEAVSGVGEARMIGVDEAAGFPSNERLQPVSDRMERLTDRTKRVRFIFSPLGGRIPPNRFYHSGAAVRDAISTLRTR